MQVKTQNIQSQQYQCFQHIMVSFHTHLLSLYMIEHYWSLCYCWHIQIMPTNNVNTQAIFMVLFTSGSLLTWGKPLDVSSGIYPRYLSTTYSQLTVLLSFFYRHPIMTDFTFSLKGWQVGEGDGLAVGEPHHLPPTTTIPHTLHNSSRAVLPYQPQGLGGETENILWHHLPIKTSWGGSHRGQEIWSIDHIGKPLSGQGPLHGGSS